MTVCNRPRYTSIIHSFNSLITDAFLSTAALFSRFYSRRIQTWAVKVAAYLARWVLRSHMQCTIEISSNCNFKVSQGSVATVKVRLKFLQQLHREFPWESISERILKIGLHLPKLWSNQKSSVLFFETKCIIWVKSRY